MGGARRGRKKAEGCQNRERRSPHCVGKATCVSHCLMNKICQTNRVGLCAVRQRRHAAAKIAQRQTEEFEPGRNLGRGDQREETGEAESTEDERRPRGKHEETKDEGEEEEVVDDEKEEEKKEREDRRDGRRKQMSRKNRGKRRR